MVKRLLVLLVLMLVFAPLVPAHAQQPAFAVKSITLKNMPAYDMRVSPDGKTAAVFIGLYAGAVLNLPTFGYTLTPDMLPIHLIDLSSGKETGQLTGNTDRLSDLAFSADGKQLFGLEYDGDLVAWNLVSKKLTNQIMGIAYPGGQLRVSADGKTVTTLFNGGVGEFLRWDMQTGAITKVIHPVYTSFADLNLSDALASLDYKFFGFDISPDGKLLATATENGKVSLTDLDTLKETVVQEGPAQKGQLNVRQLRFSLDGKTLAYYDSTAAQTIFYDVASASITMLLPVGAPNWILSPDGTMLAFSTSKSVSVVKVSDPTSLTAVINSATDFYVNFPTMVFSADNSQLIVGGFYASQGDNAIEIVSLQK